MHSGHDFSLALRHPIETEGQRLTTLRDIGELVLALPPEQREKPCWRNVAKSLLEAAETGDATEVELAYWVARTIDRPS